MVMSTSDLRQKVGTKTIIALDPNTVSTGYAVYQYGSLEKYGSWKIPNSKPLVDRIRFFSDKMKDLCNDYRPDRVFIEAPFVRFVNAAIPLCANLGGLLAASSPAPITLVPNKTWKAKLVPKADKGDKSIYTRFANAHWSIEIPEKEDDISDAVCILTYALEFEEI